MAAPNLAFGTTARISSGMLELDPEWSSGKETVRLKAIELSDRIILENSYDSVGRLIKTIYPDGQAFHYRYNTQERIEQVSSGSTNLINFVYDNDERCLTATYSQPNLVTFHYGWSASGVLKDISFPQGCLRYQRNKFGEVISLESNQGQVFHERKNNGELSDIKLKAGMSEITFNLTSGSAQVLKDKGPRGDVNKMLSPLGVHTVDSSGRVISWLRWDGDYMWFFYKSDGRIHRIWSSKGLFLLDYKNNGKICSLLRADGGRYLWYGNHEKSPVLIVGNGGVILVHYDQRGRLRKMLDSWGAYISYGYGLGNFSDVPKGISSPRWGKVEIKYGENKRLVRVTEIGKGCVSLGYDSKGELKTITWKGKTPIHIAEVLHLTGWLWCLMSAGKDTYVSAFDWAHWL
ncbi:MAG: RHS repeat protein [Proteobacteria bacterium]|nr:RHS repeat protein [Pseudomonadota bacterium]